MLKYDSIFLTGIFSTTTLFLYYLAIDDSQIIVQVPIKIIVWITNILTTY